MTQADLIERLEKGEGGDRKLDALILQEIAAPREAFRWLITTSLDDAISLVERMRPGWFRCTGNLPKPYATLMPVASMADSFGVSFVGTAASEPRALLIALLKSLQATTKMSELLANARAEMGEATFREFMRDLSGRSSWYCDQCHVEVYQLRCPHCGKTEGESRAMLQAGDRK